MAEWQFVAATVDGAETGELSSARDRSISWSRNEAPEATWAMDGRHPEASEVAEFTNDLIAYRNGRRMFRGRVGATDDDLDETGHDLSMAANGYQAILDRRLFYDPWLSADEDLGYLFWYPISYTQSLPAGYANITRGVGATTGVTWSYGSPAGEYIGAVLANLAFDAGFDFDVDANLAANLYYPRQGFPRDFVVEYGSTASHCGRSVDPAKYANAIRGTGSDQDNTATPPAPLTTPHVATLPGIASRPEGRFDLQIGDSDIELQATLVSRCDRTLEQAAYVKPAYSFTLRPGVWEPDELWIGDQTRIIVRSGRLAVDAQERIEKIDVAIGDDGDETVTLTYGTSGRERLVNYLRSYAPRITALERR